jgi:hypothetical protein
MMARFLLPGAQLLVVWAAGAVRAVTVVAVAVAVPVEAAAAAAAVEPAPAQELAEIPETPEIQQWEILAAQGVLESVEPVTARAVQAGRQAAEELREAMAATGRRGAMEETEALAIPAKNLRPITLTAGPHP